ncbi:MAG: hypothetical protein WBQ50_21395 [Nocardioides sp.]
MRKTLLVGGVLIVAAVVLVVLSDLFDLELEAAALLGLAVGAIVALVPDGRPGLRLIGFVVGIAAAWVGYLVRAGFLPDSVAGRAASIVLVLAVCVVVAAATGARVPLWSTLLGAAAVVGAFEFTYAAAPPEVMSTSLSAVTSLLMTSAIGFLAVALTAPREQRSPVRQRADRAHDADHADNASLENMMEKSQ